MKRIIFALLTALTVAACGGGQQTAPAPEAPEAKAPAAEAPAPKDAAGKLVGEWQVQLDAEQQAQIDAMKLAFKDPPPTEEELASLPEEAKFMVAMIVAARQENPDDPKVKQMREQLGQMDAMVVEFSADKVSMNLGGEKEEASYTIEAQTPTSVTLVTTKEGEEPEKMVATFENDAKVVLKKEGEEDALTLVRK